MNDDDDDDGDKDDDYEDVESNIISHQYSSR